MVKRSRAETTIYCNDDDDDEGDENNAKVKAAATGNIYRSFNACSSKLVIKIRQCPHRQSKQNAKGFEASAFCSLCNTHTVADSRNTHTWSESKGRTQALLYRTVFKNGE